jgi:hypothetical protein
MCGKLTGWNLQSRSGTKCFAVYPIFFYLQIASTGNFSELRGIRLAEFLLSENCRILHTTVSRVFSHNTHRFSTYHPYTSILLNVIQTCINVYTIEVHGLGTRGPPTHQQQNFAKSFPPWSVGSSSAPLWVTLTNCVLCSANVFLSVLAYFYVILLWLLQKNYVFYVLVFRNSENLLFLDYFL